MITFKYCIFFLFFSPINKVSTEEAFLINTRKSFSIVSDKFLSFDLNSGLIFDPHTQNGSTFYSIMKHLNPSYIRIIEPPASSSTRNINNMNKNSDFPIQTTTVLINPSVLEFLITSEKMGLIPVILINEKENYFDESCKFKNYHCLLSLIDKLNIKCMWQLNYEDSDKTQVEYIDGHIKLRYTIREFPNSKDKWKMVAGDFEKYINSTNSERIKRILEELALISDVGILRNDFQIKNDKLSQVLKSMKSTYSFWTKFEKGQTGDNFISAINWAKQVGEAALAGHEVVFRELNLLSDKSILWFSIFYKQLMGPNVMQVKYPIEDLDISVFAHCTKFQNFITKSGSITLMAINNNPEEYPLPIKFFGIPFTRILQVHVYSLTGKNGIYLNDEKLSFNLLKDDKVKLSPKIKRIPLSRTVVLNLPPNSIGFYVFPEAKASICSHEVNKFKELSLSDLDIWSTNTETASVLGKASEISTGETLDDEIKGVESNRKTKNIYKAKNALKTTSIKYDKDYEDYEGESTDSILTSTETMETTTTAKTVEKKNKIEVSLSNEEVENLLKIRARGKAEEKGINLQKDDLNKIVNHISKNFQIVDNTISLKPFEKKLRRTKRIAVLKYDANKKRDINMELLKKKTKDQDSKYKNVQNEDDEDTSSEKMRGLFKPKRIWFDGGKISNDQNKWREEKNKNDPLRPTFGLRGWNKEKLAGKDFVKPKIINKAIELNRKINQKQDKSYPLEIVEDSDEDLFGFLDSTYSFGKSFEPFDFRDSGLSLETIEGGNPPKFLPKEYSLGAKAKESKANSALQLREYNKNVEDLRKSKIYGYSQSSTEEFETDPFEFKDLDALRFKRDLGEYSDEDIQRYIEFMKEQLKHMKMLQREARLKKQEVLRKNLKENFNKKLTVLTAKNSLKPLKNKRHEIELDDSDSEAGNSEYLLSEPLKILIGKPYESDKMKINERQKEAQLQMLKNRLLRKKKLEKTLALNTEEYNSKEQFIISNNNNEDESEKQNEEEERKTATRKALMDMWNVNPEKRMKRTIKTRIIEPFNKLQNNYDKNFIYKRLTPIIKWQPKDMNKLKAEKEKWNHLPLKSNAKFDLFYKRYKRFSNSENEILTEDEERFKKYKDTDNRNLVKSWVDAEARNINDKQILKKEMIVFADKSNLKKSKNTYDKLMEVMKEKLYQKTNETTTKNNNADNKYNLVTNVVNTFETFLNTVNDKMKEYTKRISFIVTL